MKERPILFSGPMVRAILDNGKIMTRRVVKLPEQFTALRPAQGAEAPPGTWIASYPDPHGMDGAGGGTIFRCPYGVPGDRLWVRETWGLASPYDETHWFRGALGGRTLEEMCLEWEIRHRACYGSNQEAAYWRPSIFMPRSACRILLEITEVRVERLQEITGMDAWREGISIPAHIPQDGADLDYARREFQPLWESINGQGSWALNPMVWVISFRVISPEKAP